MLKNSLYIVLLLVAVIACKEKSSEHDHHNHDVEAGDAVEISENQVLYNEVMKIHDEVMPKMEDIHKKKMELKAKLTATPPPSPDEKQKIELRIAQLDSAGESMMVWMREFNPIPDSAGEEKAREYLENEMERVKKVRENILTALKEEDNK